LDSKKKRWKDMGDEYDKKVSMRSLQPPERNRSPNGFLDKT